MTETLLQYIQFAKLFIVAVYALMYGLGGINDKETRRYWAPFVVVGGLCLFSYWQSTFSWWLLAWYPLLAGANTIGYGADTTGRKILKRSLAGLAIGFSTLPIAIVTGGWLLFGLHIALMIIVSVVLGTWNPMSARGEESAIGAFSVLLPMFMID